MWQMLGAWFRVCLHPSVAGFDAEHGKESLGKATAAMLIAGVISALCGVASLWTTSTSLTAIGLTAPPLTVSPALVAIVLVTAPPATLVAFLLGSALMYGVAGVLGGKGGFTRQTYLLSLVWAPLSIASALVSLIPCVGLLLAVAIFIYVIVLEVIAIKSAHGFATGRAIGVLLIVAGLLVGICFVLAMLFALAALAVTYLLIPRSQASFEMFMAAFASHLVQAPEFFVWAFGIVLAGLLWRRGQAVALLTIVALAVLLLDSLVSTSMSPWLPLALQDRAASIDQIGVISALLAFVHAVVRSLGWGLVLAAIFGWRGLAHAEAATTTGEMTRQ